MAEKVLDAKAKKQRKSYYKSPSAKGVFHLGLELPIEYKEPFRQFAKANDRTMKPHAAHIIKQEIEKFLNEANGENGAVSASAN